MKILKLIIQLHNIRSSQQQRQKPQTFICYAKNYFQLNDIWVKIFNDLLSKLHVRFVAFSYQ